MNYLCNNVSISSLAGIEGHRDRRSRSDWLHTWVLLLLGKISFLVSHPNVEEVVRSTQLVVVLLPSIYCNRDCVTERLCSLTLVSIVLVWKCKVSYKRTARSRCSSSLTVPCRPIVSESLGMLVIIWCFVLSRRGETCWESRSRRPLGDIDISRHCPPLCERTNHRSTKSIRSNWRVN